MAIPLVGAEALRLEYPTRVVFDGLTIGLVEGDRIGIVGRNGDGKSSLLGMLSGLVEPQAGRVTPRNGIRFGVLTQSDDLDPSATVGHVIVGDRPEHVDDRAQAFVRRKPGHRLGEQRRRRDRRPEVLTRALVHEESTWPVQRLFPRLAPRNERHPATLSAPIREP